MSNYGLPYMGSKSKIVADIVPYMLGRHPDRSIFVDLFGGGVSVTDYILKNTDFTDVVYNDFDNYVTSLVDYMLRIGGQDRFIWSTDNYLTRDIFNDINKEPDSYSASDVALARIIYSFGNRGDSYLYGKDIERYKEAVHYAIMKNDYGYFDGLQGFDNMDWSPLIRSERKLNSVADLTIRRTAVLKAIYDHLKPQGIYDDAFLNRITTSEHINRIERIGTLFEGVKDLSVRLTLFNMDYRELMKDVDEDGKSTDAIIVYCDPPYEDTAEYMVGGFDSKAFWDWVRSTKDKYPVYVSSYNAPPDIECVWEQGKRGLFAMNSDNNDKIIERIYYNGYDDYTEQLFDMLGG